MISHKVKNFACPDLSNLTKNRKTSNILDNMDLPSESSKHHHDKFLTFIGFIGVGYLMCLTKYRSAPVKFEEKSKFFKSVGNRPYYFIKWSHDDQQAMPLVGLIYSVLDR